MPEIFTTNYYKLARIRDMDNIGVLYNSNAI